MHSMSSTSKAIETVLIVKRSENEIKLWRRASRSVTKFDARRDMMRSLQRVLAKTKLLFIIRISLKLESINNRKKEAELDLAKPTERFERKCKKELDTALLPVQSYFSPSSPSLVAYQAQIWMRSISSCR
jgi:hypothetical protein